MYCIPSNRMVTWKNLESGRDPSRRLIRIRNLRSSVLRKDSTRRGLCLARWPTWSSRLSSQLIAPWPDRRNLSSAQTLNQSQQDSNPRSWLSLREKSSKLTNRCYRPALRLPQSGRKWHSIPKTTRRILPSPSSNSTDSPAEPVWKARKTARRRCRSNSSRRANFSARVSMARWSKSSNCLFTQTQTHRLDDGHEDNQ